jgi:hypothetical protein
MCDVMTKPLLIYKLSGLPIQGPKMKMTDVSCRAPPELVKNKLEQQEFFLVHCAIHAVIGNLSLVIPNNMSELLSWIPINFYPNPDGPRKSL